MSLTGSEIFLSFGNGKQGCSSGKFSSFMHRGFMNGNKV
jgi:hypothetical protein